MRYDLKRRMSKRGYQNKEKYRRCFSLATEEKVSSYDEWRQNV